MFSDKITTGRMTGAETNVDLGEIDLGVEVKTESVDEDEVSEIFLTVKTKEEPENEWDNNVKLENCDVMLEDTDRDPVKQESNEEDSYTTDTTHNESIAIMKADVNFVDVSGFKHDSETCQICHKEFKDLYIHVKQFHRWNDCFQCGESFESLNFLHNHLRSIHLREKNKCPYCGKDVVVNNFKRHITDKHQRVMRQCPHCDKEFRMSKLSLHIRKEHSSGGSECPDCGKVFGGYSLMKHIKAVHNKVKTTCDICYQKVSFSNISFHKKKYHGDNQNGPTYQQSRLDKETKKERKRLAQKKYYEKNKERIIKNVVRWRKKTENKLPVKEDPDDPTPTEDFIMKTDGIKEESKIIKVGNKSLQVKLL